MLSLEEYKLAEKYEESATQVCYTGSHELKCIIKVGDIIDLLNSNKTAL